MLVRRRMGKFICLPSALKRACASGGAREKRITTILFLSLSFSGALVSSRKLQLCPCVCLIRTPSKHASKQAHARRRPSKQSKSRALGEEIGMKNAFQVSSGRIGARGTVGSMHVAVGILLSGQIPARAISCADLVTDSRGGRA